MVPSGEDERLVLDGAEKAGGKMVGLRPGVGFVGADEAGSGPGAGVGAEFVVEPESAVGGVEEDRDSSRRCWVRERVR